MKGGMIADGSTFEFTGIGHRRGRDVGVAGITLGGVERKSDFKPCATLGFTVEYQSSPVGRNNAASDRQPEPGASLAAGRGKGLKDGRLRRRWNAGAIIGHGKHGFLPQLVHRGADAHTTSTRRSGFEGVEDQIEQGLMQGRRVEGNLWQRLADNFKPHTPLLEGGSLESHNLVDERAERSRSELKMAGPRPGKHIEGQIVNTVEVPRENGPALPSEFQVTPLDCQFDGARAALEPLQDILDRMADDRHGLAHGGKPISLGHSSGFTEHLKEPDPEFGGALLPWLGWLFEHQFDVLGRVRLAKGHDERMSVIASRAEASGQRGVEVPQPSIAAPVVAHDCPQHGKDPPLILGCCWQQHGRGRMPHGGTASGRPSHHLPGVDESKAGAATLDRVAHRKQRGRGDPSAIDLGAVGGRQIAEHPPISVGRQFGMATADAAIGQRHRFGRSTEQLWFAWR